MRYLLSLLFSVVVLFSAPSRANDNQYLAVVAKGQQQSVFTEESLESVRNSIVEKLIENGLKVDSELELNLRGCFNSVCTGESDKQIVFAASNEAQTLDAVVIFTVQLIQPPKNGASQYDVEIKGRIYDPGSGRYIDQASTGRISLGQFPDCGVSCALAEVDASIDFLAAEFHQALYDPLAGAKPARIFQINIKGFSEIDSLAIESKLQSGLRLKNPADLSLIGRFDVKEWFDKWSFSRYELETSDDPYEVQELFRSTLEEADYTIEIGFETSSQTFELNASSTETGTFYFIVIVAFFLALFAISRSPLPPLPKTILALMTVAICLSLTVFRYQQLENQEELITKNIEEFEDVRKWRFVKKQNDIESFEDYLAACAEKICGHKLEAEESILKLQRAEVSRSKSLIRQVQRELNKIGYEDIPLDGVSDPRTRNAVEDFQRAVGLTITGKIDSSLLRSLQKSRTLTKTRSDYKSEDAVRKLADLGYLDLNNYQSNSNDLTKESLLADAVQRFQLEHDLALADSSIMAILQDLNQVHQDYLDDLFWAKTQQTVNIESLERYLASFPDGKHQTDAHKLLDQLRTKRDEQAAYKRYKQRLQVNGVRLELSGELNSIRQPLSELLSDCGYSVVDEHRFAKEFYPLMKATGIFDYQILDVEHTTKIEINFKLEPNDGVGNRPTKTSTYQSSYIDEATSVRLSLQDISKQLNQKGFCR